MEDCRAVNCRGKHGILVLQKAATGLLVRVDLICDTAPDIDLKGMVGEAVIFIDAEQLYDYEKRLKWCKLAAHFLRAAAMRLELIAVAEEMPIIEGDGRVQ